jgi:hypothetical protein
MGDLTPRSRGHVSRKTREERAFRLVMVGAGAGAIAVLGVILTVVGAVGAWLPVLAGLIAVACFLLFRRAVSAR